MAKAIDVARYLIILRDRDEKIEYTTLYPI